MSDGLTCLEFGWWRKPLPVSYRNLHPSLTAGRHEDEVYILADVHPGREAQGRTLLTMNLKTLQTKKYAARKLQYVPQTPCAIFVYDGLLVVLYARCCSAAVPPGCDAPPVPETAVAALAAEAEKEMKRKAARTQLNAKQKSIPPPPRPPSPPQVAAAASASSATRSSSPPPAALPGDKEENVAPAAAGASTATPSVGGCGDVQDLEFQGIEMSMLAVNSIWMPAGVMWGSIFVVFGGYDTANVVCVDMKPLVQQFYAKRVTGGLEWTTMALGGGHGPKARIDHCTAVVGNNMLVFGGRTGTGMLRNDCWSFDLVNRVWTGITLEYPAPQLLFNTAFVNANETEIGPDGATSLRLWAWGRRLKYFRPFCAEVGVTIPPTPHPSEDDDKAKGKHNSTPQAANAALTSELRLHPEDLVSDNSHCAPSFATSSAGFVYMFTVNSGATDWTVSCLVHVRPLPAWNPRNHHEHSEEYRKRVCAFVRGCDNQHGYIPTDILTSVFSYLDNADLWQSSLAPVGAPVVQGPIQDENVLE